MVWCLLPLWNLDFYDWNSSWQLVVGSGSKCWNWLLQLDSCHLPSIRNAQFSIICVINCWNMLKSSGPGKKIGRKRVNGHRNAKLVSRYYIFFFFASAPSFWGEIIEILLGVVCQCGSFSLPFPFSHFLGCVLKINRPDVVWRNCHSNLMWQHFIYFLLYCIISPNAIDFLSFLPFMVSSLQKNSHHALWLKLCQVAD